LVPFDRMFLQTHIGSLQERKEKLEWLLQNGVVAKTIANFGCHIGGETLALMWAFGATEAIGIDKDEMAIDQAQSTLEFIREDVTRIWRELQYYPDYIAVDDKLWWHNDVPDFIKRDLIQDSFHLNYIVHDICQPIDLLSDYCDLSYCDFVLHHIWYDVSRSNPRDDTLNAIREMTRVVKPNGVVAMSELLQFSDKPKLEFESLFELAGLEIVYKKVTEVDDERRKGTFADYICRKSTMPKYLLATITSKEKDKCRR